MKVLADLWLYGADVQVYYTGTLRFSVTDTGLEYWGQKAPTAPGDPSTFLRIDEVGQQYYSAIDINDITGLDNRINELGADTLASVSVNSTDAAKSLYTMSSGVAVEFRRSAGSTLLYLDETNGRIGVNTTSPTYDNGIEINGGTSNGVGGVYLKGALHNGRLYIGTDHKTYLSAGYQLELQSGSTTVFSGHGGTYIANAVPSTPRGLVVLPITSAYKGLVVQGRASQAANLQEWVNSASVILGAVDATGQFAIGHSSPSANLDVVGTVQFVTGNQGDGKVLFSDAQGNADWATIDYSDIQNTPSSFPVLTSNGVSGNGQSGTPIVLGGTLSQHTTISFNDLGGMLEPVSLTFDNIPIVLRNQGLQFQKIAGTNPVDLFMSSTETLEMQLSYGQNFFIRHDNFNVNVIFWANEDGIRIGEYLMPLNQGSNTQVLTSDGAGNASWASIDYSSISNTPSIPNNYVSNVSLVGNSLTFTGVGSAFNSTVDLSAYASGGESLSDTLAIGNTTGNRAILANKDYGYILTNGTSQSYKIYAPAGPLYINSDSSNGGQGIEISVTGAAQSSATIWLKTNNNLVAVNDSNKVKIVSVNALSLKANGGINPNALLSTSLIADTDKTFEFPNWSGTISTIDRIGGKPVNSNITSPGAGENGYVIQWDNALGQYKLVAGGGGSDGNDYVNSASFNTGTGVLTLTRTDTGTVTVDLDGRYLESETPQNLFETISRVGDSGFTWGGTDIVANSPNDTLKLVPGSGISIDTDASGKAIRIVNTRATGLTNAYTKVQVGGTTIFSAGADTFQFRSTDSSINLTLVGDDAIYGDNLDLTIASVAWSLVTSTPTTLSGYGITDAYTQTQLQTSGQSSVHWGNLTNVPTYDNYGGWTVSDGTNSEQISSGNTLTFAATGDADVTYDTGTNTLTIGVTGSGANDYVDSATFSTTTGVLTLGRTGLLTDLTVDLDDRWSLIGHSHSSTDITDWAEAVDDRVGSLLVAGSNITLDYNDVANTLTISASGGATYTAGTGLALTGSEFSNTDLGSAQNIFKNIANSAGTTQFSAATNTDTIRFAGSGASSVAFDAGTKTVTVSSTDTTYGAANGLTLNSGNFELGGTITKNTTIDGGFQMYYGSGTKLSGFRVYTTNDIFLNTDGGLTLNLSDSLAQIELSAGASDVYVSGNIVSISGTDTRIPYGAGTAAGKLLQTTNINGTVDGTPYAFPTSTGADGQILKLSSGNLVWAADDGGGGGATTFTGLTDTPSAYTGAGLQFVRVNAGATALEFINADTLYADVDHIHTFAEITSKPTTISGYGISDALIFRTINRAADSGFTWGTSDVVAASSTETVKFVPGTGINIQTDATNKGVRWSLSASLNDLSDVNTSGASDGAALVYNGTSWTPSVITFPSATVPTETGYSGTTITLTAGGTITAGDLVAINVSGQAVRASAGSATKTGPAIGYATSSVTSSQSLVVLVDGFIYKQSHGLTTGSVVYVGTTAGATVHNTPSGSGDLVQVVGVVINANVILARLTLNVVELT